MNKSHIKSTLALKGVSHPIDEHTKALFHFDHHAYDHTGTIRPLGVYPDIEEGLVGYWDFSKEQEIAYDLSGNDNHGSIVGATWGNGRNGKALSFDGVDDYIDTKLGLEGATSYTIEVWINSTSTSTQEIVARYPSPSVELYVSGSSVRFRGNGSTSTEAVVGGFSGNSWCHIVAIVDAVAKTSKLYLNTIKGSDGSLEFINNFAGNEQVYIGAVSEYSQLIPFKGLVDKVAIYNRALSEEEIQAHYNEGIYTIRKDGKHGGAMAVEEGTENIIGTGHALRSDVTKIEDHHYRVATTTENISGILFTSVIDTNNGISKTFSGYILGELGLCICIQMHSKVETFILSGEWDRFSITAPSSSNGSIALFVGYSDSPNVATTFQVVDCQVEQKLFPTSFVDGAREDGKLIYPTNISGDFTCSFWCKFNYEWYNNLSGYSKKMIRFNNSIDGGHITWTDWGSSLGSSFPYLDLEPNTYWDGVQHHWHDAFQYSADKWYYITFIKSGNSMRQIVYNDLAEKCNDRVFTYTDSSKFANFSFDQIVFFGEWCTLIDELRIDDIARTDEEIYAWYVSSAPHFPPDRIKAIG